MNVSNNLTVVILNYYMFRLWQIITRWIQNIVVAEYDRNKINTGVHTNSVLSSYDVYVGIAMDYGLDRWGWISDKGKFFSIPQRPDRLWCPPNRYWRPLHTDENGHGLKLTLRVYLVSRSRMVELNLHSSVRLYVVMLNN
jgi:hypothetical protein